MSHGGRKNRLGGGPGTVWNCNGFFIHSGFQHRLASLWMSHGGRENMLGGGPGTVWSCNGFFIHSGFQYRLASL